MTTETSSKPRRRLLLSRQSRVLLILLAVLLAYGFLVEPIWLQVTHHDVTLPRLSSAFNNLRIVQLSDIHCGPFYLNSTQIARAVRDANALHPDLIVLTGDFVNRAGNARRCARLLSPLHARYGVIAVLGNHDYWTDHTAVTAALTSVGIRVLKNEAISIRRGTSRLWVAGLDDAWEGKPDLSPAVKSIPRGEPTLLLVHEPDVAMVAAQEPVDLQLSGHVHGGQVRLPWMGAIFTPHLGHRYTMGVYRVETMPLYVSRGVGVTFPGAIRLNCRPEVTCITLHANMK